jgi:SAM-dependent methyltransferase
LIDTRFGISGSYDVLRCAACGLEQTYPIPSSAELKVLYEAYYNYGGERDTVYTRIREWFHLSPVYRLWLLLDGDISFHQPRGAGRLLDIGCNEGRGLMLYSRNGFHAEGLELNETAARVAREKGFTVHTCLLREFKPLDLYDVVVLSNVLEHSVNPKEMLADVGRILKDDGQVWISCPNNQSWQRRVFGRKWANWHAPFHIVHLSATTLKSLLLGSGFTKIEIGQITPALWVAANLITTLFARCNRVTKELRNPFLVMSLMLFVRGLLFPFLWLGNLLGRGDCLVVTARKS